MVNIFEKMFTRARFSVSNTAANVTVAAVYTAEITAMEALYFPVSGPTGGWWTLDCRCNSGKCIWCKSRLGLTARWCKVIGRARQRGLKYWGFENFVDFGITVHFRGGGAIEKQAIDNKNEQSHFYKNLLGVTSPHSERPRHSVFPSIMLTSAWHNKAGAAIFRLGSERKQHAVKAHTTGVKHKNVRHTVEHACKSAQIFWKILVIKRRQLFRRKCHLFSPC